MSIISRLKKATRLFGAPQKSFKSFFEDSGFSIKSDEVITPEVMGGTAVLATAALLAIKSELPQIELTQKVPDLSLLISLDKIEFGETRTDRTVAKGSTHAPEGLEYVESYTSGSGSSQKTLYTYIEKGADLFSGTAQGISYHAKHGRRPKKYHNIGNLTWRPGRQFYEGQVGYEQMEYYGTTGDKRTTYFAVFSDPYYGIKAFYERSVLGKSASDKTFTQNYSNYTREYNYLVNKGIPIPPNRKTLYRLMAHLAPPTDRNDTLGYAKKIADSDPAAWPQGINTLVDASNNKAQFISLMKTIAKSEQGTILEDWYLGLVYEAMFNGGPKPLQENLANRQSKGYSSSNKSVFISPGSINSSRVTSKGNRR